MESTVPTLSKETFRQALAGLVEESGPMNYGEYRELAARICALLAAHYNRETLDPIKLWTRIESAIKTAVEKATDDPASLLSAALEHVKADATRVTKDAEFMALIEALDGLDDNAMKGLRQYLRKSLYTALVFGRKAWDERKKKTSGRLTVDDEAAAREAGQKATRLFPEDEVEAALAHRAEMRGEA